MTTIQPARALVAAGMLAVGIAMIVMAAVTGVSGGRQLAETVIGSAVILFGLVLFATGLVEDRPMPTSLPTGILTILGSLLYLGTALPRFHAGAVPYNEAIVQFVTVLAGLFVGAASFALREPAVEFRRGKRMYPTTVGPDGVVLVVGTILIGLGIGETAQPRLTPPTWDWVSFFLIAIPGMLVLIPMRGMAKAMLRRERLRGRRSGFAGILVNEALLVVGLAVLLYGFNNVFAGTNGFETGFEGDGGGLAVWLGAALFLVAVRGGFKLALADGPERPGAAVARELLYVLGLAAFVYGERWVITGSHLTVESVGGFLAASGILVGGLALLVPIRLVSKATHRLRALPVVVGEIAELPADRRGEVLRRLDGAQMRLSARRRLAHERALADAARGLPADLALELAAAQEGLGWDGAADVSRGNNGKTTRPVPPDRSPTT